MGALMAVSDLHIGHRGNRDVVESIEPDHPDDWLIVAGDVGEKVGDIAWALSLLRSRFQKVVWVPGNHELWSVATDPVQLRGDARYRHLVALCRDLDVVTPEDDFPVWPGSTNRGARSDQDLDGPVVVAPLFLLYDYTFLPHGARDRAEGMALAERHRAVSTDEHLLDPHPYPNVAAWSAARVDYTRGRLAQVDPKVPLVLVNHYPLRREPTQLLLRPEFAMWCGTTSTEDWHRRYNVACMVYGHLHIRRTDYFDDVRFEEVSLGYPREWMRRGLPNSVVRQILPVPRRTPTGPERNASSAHLQRMFKRLASFRAGQASNT
jgi:3',5'-cyclic AMP phosphodiesterase CpdA